MQKVVRTLAGVPVPQGVVYSPETNKLFVGSDEGKLYIYDGTKFDLITSIDFGDDVDNLRYDASQKRVYVGFGDGESAAIQDLSGHNGLLNLNRITTDATFTIQNGPNFSSIGDFTNDGTLTVGAGSTFTHTQNRTFSQTGTLRITAGGTASLLDGSVTDTGTLSDAGTLIIAPNNTGFTVSGTYSQDGTLNVQGKLTLNTASIAGIASIRSATFFSVAASFFTKPRLVGVVGEDFPEEHRQLFTRPNLPGAIDLAGGIRP